MKFRIFLILIISFLLSFSICPMAKNIYSTPDLSKTSNKFEGFTIDFKGIDTPEETYWALCRWNMDLTEFKKNHQEVTGGNAYGGLQTKLGRRVAILSFWEVGYKENEVAKTHRANRMYPKGEESAFGGEGEGTNYISDYNWETNVWYRFVMHSWVDSSTKDTYVGEWIQNLNTKEWTLFAYFNTNLKDSYMTQRLSFFQENFNGKTFGKERFFQIKNMYALDKEYEKWISLNKTTLSYDPSSWGYDTAGTHDIGYSQTYFYGSSGLPVDDQKLYDESNPSSITGTIKQPDSPEFNKAEFKSFTTTVTNTEINVNWSMDSKTCPCYMYQIQIMLLYDTSNHLYKTIQNYRTYKPEDNNYSYISNFKGSYTIILTCYDICGDSSFKTTTKTVN